MTTNDLTRRAVLAGTASTCLVAAVPVAGGAIPPKIAAFTPEAARLLENGSPAARRMVAWVAAATDDQLDWLTSAVEEWVAGIALRGANLKRTEKPQGVRTSF